MMDIKEYLDREIGEPMPLKDVVRTIRRNLAPELVAQFNRFIENGIGDCRKMYGFLAERANGRSIYDYFMQAYREGHEAKHNAVLGRVLSVNPRTLLDMCCGTGIDTCLFAQALGEKSGVCGADFSEEMLKRAAERARRMKLDNILFQKADLDDMPFEEPRFDVVTCFMGLFEGLGVDSSHPQYKSIEAACAVGRLIGMRNALNPNGLLVCSAPIPNEPAQAEYTETKLKRYLARADFRNVQTEVIGLKRKAGEAYSELFGFATKE